MTVQPRTIHAADEGDAATVSPTGVPLVHMGGTGKQGLINQLSEVCGALQDAHAKLRQAGPHMRDYYPYPSGGEPEFKVARERHSSRLQRLEELQTELEELAGLIDAQAGR